eukprot:1176801-Prorocentrum_minimum.AAC.1
MSDLKLKGALTYMYWCVECTLAVIGTGGPVKRRYGSGYVWSLSSDSGEFSSLFYLPQSGWLGGGFWTPKGVKWLAGGRGLDPPGGQMIGWGGVW